MEKSEIEKEVLDANGFSSFNPMQKKALAEGLFEKSIVISAPTAAGKTIIAELCALHSILNNKKKVVYTCPLRALASEHFNDFKKKYSKKLGIRMAISTGDFDSSSNYLQNYDLIFCTNEKLDSLLRHRAEWLQSIGLLVVDEIHELDSDRGPTIEMVITKLRHSNPSLQFLALSATIPNSKEIAQWLGAKLVQSDYRPVKLLEGVLFDSIIDFKTSKEEIEKKKEPLASVVSDTLKKQKQALVFANTRKRSEGMAKKLSELTAKSLSPKEKLLLEKAAQQILGVLEFPTEQCHSLAQTVKNGVAFHNAGLLSRQREIVEGMFRERVLKIVCATPTLAAGINLPAYRVVIPSLYRYTSAGNVRIPVREYKQISGRAGRPKFDSAGESVIFASSQMESDELFETYINGEIESITSKIGIEPVLRTHLLSAIATHYVFDLASMEEFFSKTFYAHQFGDMTTLFGKLSDVLSELKEMGFVQLNEKKISATPVGNRVSELYLDPFSAHKIILALRKNKFFDLSYLFLLADTSEFSPQFSVSKKNEPQMWERLQEESDLLPVNTKEEMFYDNHLLQKFNSTVLLNDWINEVTEQNIVKQFNTAPGLLRTKLLLCDWLSYAAAELAKLLELKTHLPPLNRLRKRLKHGVKAELVFLTELRGIGRVRARRLFNAGIRTISDVKKTDIKDLEKILPPAVAVKVKQELKQ